MSVDGSIDVVWGDGESHKFKFGIGQFRELQEKVNSRRVLIGAPVVGPMVLLTALQANDAWPDDIRDILRIGMLGAGTKATEVHRLMANYFDATGPLNHMKTAHTILLAGLVGANDEIIESKKKTVPATPETPSNSLHSTGQALQ